MERRHGRPIAVQKPVYKKELHFKSIQIKETQYLRLFLKKVSISRFINY